MDRSPKMFADSESQSVLLSDDRRFNINRVVRVRAKSNRRIEIANFAPADLTDVDILLSIDGGPSNIVVARVGSLPAHAIAEFDYPFLTDGNRALDTSGRPVDLSAYADGIDQAAASFDFTSPGGLAKRLAGLGHLNWDINFYDYNPTDTPGRWANTVLPLQARLYTAIYINHAMIFSHSGFRDDFLAAPLTGNNQEPLSAEAKQDVYARILNHGRFRTGVASSVSGLGGGSTFGAAHYVLAWHLKKQPYQDGTFPHEVGHKLGFAHSSNMTYPVGSAGFVRVTGKWIGAFHDNGWMPITRDNYYSPSDY